MAIKGICAAKLKNRLEQEERERRWAEEAKLRRERDRQEALEKTRRERLSQHIEAWQTSKGLTAFADAVAANTPPEDETQEWRDWISWIRDQALALDPLTQRKRPWHEWAAHVGLSQDTQAKSQIWPGHHVWKTLNV